MKYSDAFEALSSILDAAKLPVWPADAVPSSPPLPRGLVHFIPSGKGVNYGSVSGVIIVDILVQAGSGPKQAHDFADTLDQWLVKKSHAGVQLFDSSLAPRGPYKAAPTLTLYEYTVNFKFFGVS